MAIAYATRLDHANTNNDTVGCSNLVADATKIHYCYETRDALGDGQATTRIYYRNYTVSGGALSTQVDVSGLDASLVGFGNPSLAMLADGTLICGYSRGKYTGLYSGFVVKESTDGGATWANTYTGDGGASNDGAHVFCGLYYDPISNTVAAVTQESYLQSGRIKVRKRTGAGTWTSVIAFTGSGSDPVQAFNFISWPNQNAIYYNGSMVIVGPRTHGERAGSQPDPRLPLPISYGSISSLHTSDITTASAWSELSIAEFPALVARRCLLVRGNDTLIRLLYSNSSLGGDWSQLPGDGGQVATTGDFGMGWTIWGQPEAFNTNYDSNFDTLWPPASFDLHSLAIDARDQQFITFTQYDRIHIFRNWVPYNIASWQWVETTQVANGGITYQDRDSTQQPASSIVFGNDLYRVLGVWDAITTPSTPYSHLWLLKAGNIATTARAAVGGGTVRGDML